MKYKVFKILVIVMPIGFLISCNNQKSNEISTETGLIYEILEQGQGEKTKIGDEVIVHETMGYLDGTILYSTKGMNNLPKILIGGGQAIDGVDEGIRGMQVGEIRKLVIPPSLSKRKQYPKFLSPDSTLLYKIELVEIIKQEKTQDNDKKWKPSSEKSGFEMISVKGGNFIMGGDDNVNDGGSPELRIADECPHPVTIKDFNIGKYEVTQADWEEIMRTNPSKEKDCDDCPVNQISWDDIQEFIMKVNLKYSENYRLPTEEEWEFAAKGGLESKNFMYSGSDNAKDVAWFSVNSNNESHPVGLLNPNELGIYDMSGNIWEWCNNAKTPYPCDTIGKIFESKVLRGGSFSHRQHNVRVNDRNGRNQTMSLPTLGFRLAK